MACQPKGPPTPPRKTNLDLAISNATLPNGLRVVLVRDPRAHDIQLTMRYGVGAVDDPVGQAGIAHLVEHLMFQQVVGTESIFAKLESQAHAFNAFTTPDATTFIARAAPEKLESLLAIEAVRFGFRCTSITPSAYERERAVVVNELAMRGRLDSTFNAFHRAVYSDLHPYARVSNPDQVAAITMEQACAFADAHYAPTNAVLVVSGNLDATRLTAALGKMVARMQRREAVPAAKVEAARGAKVKLAAPLSDDAVLIAWPMPTDPGLRARTTAVTGIVAGAVDQAVKGSVTMVPLGDQRAPMLGFLVTLTEGETSDAVIEKVRKAVADAPYAFTLGGRWGQVMFNRLQQLALFEAFAGFEDGSERDTEIAAQVLAGREPKVALAAVLHSLRSLRPVDAAALVEETFAFSRASIAVLEADEQTRGSDRMKLAKPVHDIGQHRDVPDPTDAHQPADEPIAAHVPDELVTRTLPNGLRVVLLPVTSVPTVDVRMVFAAGTADEPVGKRGVATVAARALRWGRRSLSEWLALAESGGATNVDVTRDHTVFKARGLDMHVDYLLAGLHELVVDGTYSTNTRSLMRALRSVAKYTDDEGALSDAYNTAIYGAGHPYVAAGVPRHLNTTLTLDDVKSFRAARFTPGSATLVVSGRFDPALANRWIDHLFSSWTGTPAPRAAQHGTVSATSLAKTDTLAQIQLEVTLPAVGGGRAERLIAAEMLDEIVGDVRHQLGAAYTFDAYYDEERLSTTYAAAGSVDAARTHEAITLIRDRLAALRADNDATARAFIKARKRVLAQLSTTPNNAVGLGAEVTRDLSIGRGLMSDARLAQEVQMLTLERMTAALADLTLDRAAIMMRGPEADITRAFAVLGRTPQFITATRDDSDSPFDDAEPTDDEYDAPLDDDRAPPFTLGLMPGYATGEVSGRGVSGASLTAHAGLRIERRVSIGLQLSVGKLEGANSHELLPITGSLFIQVNLFNRVWASVLGGFRFQEVVAPLARWETGIAAGAEAGIDLLRHQRQRLSVFFRYEHELDSWYDINVGTLGLGYRFY